MRLATVRTNEGTRAARVSADGCVLLDAPDVGALLARDDWAGVAASAAEKPRPVDDAAFAPVVPRPGKVLCVGLNYRPHILEMGRDLPEYPTLFAKFPEALIGARDHIQLAPESSAVDWEAELALVIGRPVRRASEDEAARAIAGFTVMNDVSMRDWQFRTKEWLQGKTFEGTTPLGPVLVTPDELPGGVRPVLPLTCRVDGEVMQKADTSDLVFDPVALVRYASTIVTLRPGDVIATGTPGGVGHARKPPRYLADGVTVVTEIGGIGRLENTARTP
ncbi:fumarylacetoacetate hydrolase family protein [Actinomadura madurae]|uniref:fumarylacetoacetate hydrolase family protein n=1 Tax=Actinomadura madurae TaxID=1993 RepID=UPI0020D238E8|nr:fumarylacetoacetate hydrolase family protein [Actinomadura madurae]MCP9948154.1 fumarylacetoacetate hydrolase family protein [Actinomadura madurae]MCP9964926.1 fumarylacetoacetate hydrolase family protein [Actinomadura madurae]MCP9977413.1 fumarylacetoacetate hydrolase family protein [Actinomadura madurae]MCQ0013596.1 fumarylacetoacetate hydrolase family protein [Actinomadura madurae]